MEYKWNQREKYGSIRDGQFNKESNLFKLMTEYLICNLFLRNKMSRKNLGTLKWPTNEQQQEMYPYRTFNCSSIKKGYSGVGVIFKIPWQVNHGSIPTLEDDHECIPNFRESYQ